MKQLVIIEIQNCEDKHRSKAIKIAVCVPGVESVALQGEEKNQLAVTGDEVDSVYLMDSLRKKIRRVELLSVTPLDEDSLDDDDDDDDDDALVTEPEFQYPTYHFSPLYQPAVPYNLYDRGGPTYVDNDGCQPIYYENPGYRSNYYDSPVYRSNNQDSCTTM